MRASNGARPRRDPGRGPTWTTHLAEAENGVAAYAYNHQWIRVDGATETAIPGATSKTYTLVQADEGETFRSTVHDYFSLWSWDGTLDRIHHALYLKCREKVAREASPTACIIGREPFPCPFFSHDPSASARPP